MSAIALFGASGYIGSAIRSELAGRGMEVIPVGRKNCDCASFDALHSFLRHLRPAIVINAAGYTGNPNVDACEKDKEACFDANVRLPMAIAAACARLDITLGHVSSGCIYSGMDRFRWVETDTPNFSFPSPPSSFYSGTKAAAECLLAQFRKTYLWRLRIPFDHQNHRKNYISKLLTYPKLLNATNSLSHRGDFVKACVDMWMKGAPFGIYNLTNPGFVTTRQVVGLIQEHLPSNRKFEFWESETEFYRHRAIAPRSNCVLDTAKAESVGVRMRSVIEALEDSLRKWSETG